jgi:lysophospholipid acyltransferase 7
VFAFMMLYLFFFRVVHLFNFEMPSGHANMIQMIITLKVIGYAFERNTVFTKIYDAKKNNTDLHLTVAERDIRDSSLIDLFNYSFNYIGLLTGPYYTYRTYSDYFHYPFGKHAKTWQSTLDRLKFVPLFVTLFVVASYIWPLSYATSDEFYESRSFLYRLFYIWPTFFIFRMRIYSGTLLAEALCINSGFGAVPVELEPRCGHGQSKEVTDELIERSDKCEYNFITIENIDAPNVEKCLTFREGMKHWNCCIQYWLAMYVYKRFPSKKLRVIATMAVSAYWHGEKSKFIRFI